MKNLILAFAAAGALAAIPSFAETTASADAPKKDSAASETTIGGYGEIGYNNYVREKGRDVADLKRFVLFLGHRFNERLSFNSEVEWEHAVTSFDDQGESEIEQVYLDYQYGRALNVKAGLFLMPFGFINQSHEPPVFYGVERNEVETRIIPSTWREGGLGLSGSLEFGLDWDAGVTTGFDIAKFDDQSHPLSSIHQELQFAKADDPSFYAALNYRGLPGFTIGGALFTGDAGQSNADFRADISKPDLSGISARVTLWDVHTRWQDKGLDLQAVYAMGMIGDAKDIDNALLAFNATNLGTAAALVPDQFYGWLTQAAYTFWLPGDMSLSPFARYEMFDTQLKMPSGAAFDPANADKAVTGGLSFKPHAQVVVKADYQRFLDHKENDRFNLGLGYMF